MKPTIGIDIVENARIQLQFPFLNKFLSQTEIAYVKTLQDPRRQREFCAGRWALKEAIYKILKPEEQLTLNQIEIDDQGCGLKVLYPQGLNLTISLAHEKKYSVAVALRQT